jgi:hypothetical protein
MRTELQKDKIMTRLKILPSTRILMEEQMEKLQLIQMVKKKIVFIVRT